MLDGKTSASFHPTFSPITLSQTCIMSALQDISNFKSSVETPIIILANGTFPTSSNSLRYFNRPHILVCCDGATNKAVQHGQLPDLIIGDLDSLAKDLFSQFGDRVIRIREQDTNDLSKAFHYCVSKGWKHFVILGASGEREDHTLGNISLLADFSSQASSVQMRTDYGLFLPATTPGRFTCKPKQQISIFSFDPNQEITSKGLKYPLNHLKLNRWYQATLNEAEGSSFELDFNPSSPLILFFTD